MLRSDLLKLLTPEMHAQRFGEGDCIIKQGEEPREGVCLILAGSARVIQSHGEHDVTIGYIHAGQFFGETAMILKRVRSASVFANENETTVLFIDHDRFMEQAHESYEIVRILVIETMDRIAYVMQALARTRRKVQIRVDPSLVSVMKENRGKNQRIPDLINHTRNIFVGHDKPVFQQGDRNNGTIYMVTSGKIALTRKLENEVFQVWELEAGDLFGYSRVRTMPFREYTAQALGDSARIISFDEELFFKIMRFDMDLFYNLFRTLITQLVILNDTLRLTVASLSKTIGSDATREEILRAMASGPRRSEQVLEDGAGNFMPGEDAAASLEPPPDLEDGEL